MRFVDRDQAARQLAEALASYEGQRPLVLGLPRGAVPMAAVIAGALDGDLDVALVRKLRAEHQPEFAIGAVDETGTVLEGPHVRASSARYLEQEIAEQREVLRRRRARYAQARPPVDPAGRLVILVDDGLATGATMRSAIGLMRARGARRVVVAVGVAPPDTLARLREDADDVVCLMAPRDFMAVGQFYDDFSEVSDEEVVAALAGAPRASEAGGPAR